MDTVENWGLSLGPGKEISPFCLQIWHRLIERIQETAMKMACISIDGSDKWEDSKAWVLCLKQREKLKGTIKAGSVAHSTFIWMWFYCP